MITTFHKNILIFCTNITQKLEIQTLLFSNEISQQNNIQHNIHNLIQQNKIQTDVLTKQLTLQSNNSRENKHSPLVCNTIHYSTPSSQLSISSTKKFINKLIRLNKTIDTILLKRIKKTSTYNRNMHTNISHNTKRYSKQNIPILFNKENQYISQLIKILKAIIDGYITNNKNTIRQCIEQCSRIELNNIYNEKDKNTSDSLSKNTFIIRLHTLILQILKSM